MDPKISVVMGVYNGATAVRATAASILAQDDVSLELIIINDGSIDKTAAILERLQRRDSRVRVLDKPINKGEFIARQDCGDASLPGRLHFQLSALQNTPEWTLLATGVRYSVDGLVVLESHMLTPELQAGLSAGRPQDVFGPPHHGATMFRRDAYEQAGGYRPEFYFAQDIDLWLRLAEIGGVGALDSCLYTASLDASSISGRYHKEQRQLKALALECRGARLNDKSEQPYLERARAIRPGNRSHDASIGEYFIGRLMEPIDRDKALGHYCKAVAANPMNWKARVRRLQLRMKVRTP